jgi:hypothetical protein
METSTCSVSWCWLFPRPWREESFATSSLVPFRPVHCAIGVTLPWHSQEQQLFSFRIDWFREFLVQQF